MKFALFYHSLLSDWNHGNAHFLRGYARELLALGHEVTIYEPGDAWSRKQLEEKSGGVDWQDFKRVFPTLQGSQYCLEDLNFEAVAEWADVVVVHEWNEPRLLKGLVETRKRQRSDFLLLFHDTHHRAVSSPFQLSQFPLQACDGALVFGEILAEVYRKRRMTSHVFVWHEAADAKLFSFAPKRRRKDSGVWIGNWGDNERSEQLKRFLFEPAKRGRIEMEIYGVRYPANVLEELSTPPFSYRGYLPNLKVPETYSENRFAVHIPRDFYADRLPGIPTIRVFEALASGIPLLSSPWNDTEGLFTEGQDYLIANSGQEMEEKMRYLLDNPGIAEDIGSHGRATVLSRHTCRDRVYELLSICERLGKTADTPSATSSAQPAETLSSGAL